MILNWKTLLGSFLILGALTELFDVVKKYNNGELQSWPFGVEIGAILIISLGVYLINKGRKYGGS